MNSMFFNDIINGPNNTFISLYIMLYMMCLRVAEFNHIYLCIHYYYVFTFIFSFTSFSSTSTWIHV